MGNDRQTMSPWGLPPGLEADLQEDARQDAALLQRILRSASGSAKATGTKMIVNMSCGGRPVTIQVEGSTMPKKQLTVLFVSACPDDQVQELPIKTQKEARGIEDAIRKSEYRQYLKFVPKGAVLARELQGLLLDERPDVIHFSGHGNTKGICLQNQDDSTAFVETSALASLLGNFKETVRAVLLNSCYS